MRSRLSKSFRFAAFASFWLAAPAAFAQSAPLVPVRIAELGVSLASMPQQFAREKGFFVQHGIDLQVIRFVNGGAEAMAGVASGQVDLAVIGRPILTGISFGLPVKIVGSPPSKKGGFELVARKGITSVAELRGKVVTGGALGGGSHQSLLKILAANGLGEDDVKIIASGGADAEMVLRSGKVDAVVTQEAVRLKLVDDGRGTLIAKARDYYGHYQSGFVLATNQFINDHPDAIRNYFIATRDYYKYEQASIDELVEYSASRVKLRKELIRAYFLEQFGLLDLTFAIDLEGTANAVNYLKELKEVKAGVNFDPNTWLDLRFLD